MGRRFKKKPRLIRGFLKGQHQDNPELEEDWLDWFFLRNFNRGIGYWRNLTDDKILSLITLENEKEKEYWEIWSKMYSKIYGGK